MGYLDMLHTSREGIRYASIYPDQNTGIKDKMQSATNRYTVEEKTETQFNSGSPGINVMWIYIDVPNLRAGDPVTIHVKAGIVLLTNFLGGILGHTVFHAGTEAVMTIE